MQKSTRTPTPVSVKSAPLTPPNERDLRQLEALLMQQAMSAACDMAQALYQRACTTGMTARAWDKLAFYLGRMHQHAQALHCYDSALSLAPGEAALHFNRAMVLRFLGRMAEAEQAVNRCLALTPADSEALALRTDLRTQTAERNHVAQLQAQMQRTNDPVARTRLHFALAKELEDLSRYQEAFSVLAAGARLRRTRMQYSVKQDLLIMDALRRQHDTAFLADRSGGYPSSEPVFILGMPRAGSTLLERMLASHSAFDSAGELDNFALQMVQQVKARGATAGREELVAQSRLIDFAALGKAYVDSTRPLTGHTPHFIDKLPLNFLYVGLIAKSLPKATIIHIHRNPMDSCYAMFKRLFHNAYPFSYQLDELAQYYAGYRRLMAHWHQCLPGRIIDVAYEDLVADAETTLTRVLSAMGLTFEPECLQYHRQQSASTTASAAQVRQQVYRSSVAKWRHYEQELAPLADALRAAGVSV